MGLRQEDFNDANQGINTVTEYIEKDNAILKKQ